MWLQLSTLLRLQLRAVHPSIVNTFLSGASDETILKTMGVKENAGAFTRKFFGQILKFYKQRSVGSILGAFYDTVPIALFILLPIFSPRLDWWTLLW